MIIKNMPFSDYLAHPAVNNSLLKLVAKAPALARAYFDGTYTVETTPSMKRGTLVHTLVLEPDEFDLRYAIAPECDRRTKAGKEEFETFTASLNGREIITQSDYDTARAMRDAVMAHEMAALLLQGSEREVSIFSGLDGLECKARLDIARTDGIIMDLKTCTDASKAGFGRAAANLDYPVAAAFYLDIAEVSGMPATDYGWIAVESSPPHLVATYNATARDIEIGRTMYRERLATLKRCRETGEWPGIGAGQIQPLAMPSWWGRDYSGDY